MDEFVKAFRRFLHRDLAFLLGGACIVLAFLFCYDRLPTEALPIPQLVLGVGVSYILGYVAQDVATLLHLVRTNPAHDPSRIGRFLYWLYERHGSEYLSIGPDDYFPARKVLLTRAPWRVWADHERIESLKQLGTTMGPSLILSGVLVLGKDFVAQVPFGTSVGSAALALGLILVALGWLKVTQQGQSTIAEGELYKDDPLRAPREQDE